MIMMVEWLRGMDFEEVEAMPIERRERYWRHVMWRGAWEKCQT
jgi:hypothetical protein